WPEVLRIIRHARPRYVLLENVPGHLSLGFGRVLGDLAESGYDAEWDCIPAAAVGAPHLRDRLFVVAYPERQRPAARKASPHSPEGRHQHRLRSEPAGRRLHLQPRLGGPRGWPAEPGVDRVANG